MRSSSTKGATKRGSKPPRWTLDSIYPGFDSPEYQAATDAFRKTAQTLLKRIEDTDALKQTPDKWLKAVIKKLDAATGLYETLGNYVYCAFSVNTQDETATRELNRVERDGLLLKDAMVRLRERLKSIRKRLPKLIAASKSLTQHEFFINEQLRFQAKQMSIAEESLAADLSLPGADAWGRLQESVSSTLSVPWDGEEQKTVVELRALAYAPDRATRENAFRKEIQAWKSMEIPLAAALNGVKGFSVALNKRRNYDSAVEQATLHSRITPETLHALISVMDRNLPTFRRYLNTKAKLLGLKKLAFFDLFAPVGAETTRWSFAQARDFIIEQFTTFSWELGEFAERAFKERWIDAEPREGKVGGAFCAGMPVAKQSRIMSNFAGSFSDVMTLAHELGHAYHGFVLADEPFLYQDYPMTLAETASIFCETIVFNRALETVGEDNRLAVIETFLQDSTQVIVDILSRFTFEKALFERRTNEELSPAELCSLMLDAQDATYGTGLDKNERHPYMWAVKGHYYSADLPFYNFPYAFGQLFGLGLYAQYRQEEQQFPARYKQLLQMTGRATANEVTRQAGFDIEQETFWQQGIDQVTKRVDEFVSLVNAQEKRS
jgi:oligoendopeptidase F